MSPRTAPNAPGRLGEPVDLMELRTYLIELDGWLDARRGELEALDEAVRTSEHAEALTPDIALGLQLWQAIQNRYRRLLQVWDRGRVGRKEREQLASLVWGRLDEGAWGGSTGSGLSLPEACRMSDALTGQLRSRLQLDPAGTEAVGRLRDLRASMERLRDQVALEPPETQGRARAQLGALEERLESMSEKAGRGGDIGGLLGPLEADAATFERDLIVGGVLRRQGGAAPQPPAAAPQGGGQQAQQPPAPAQPSIEQRREHAGRLRADLISRGQQLDEFVARVVAQVPNPPKYAVPDVSALGPVPSQASEIDGYLARLERVGKAMEQIDRAYSEALRTSEVLGNELIMLRSEIANQKVADPLLDQLMVIADQMAAMKPRPDQALDVLMDACLHYTNWLAGSATDDGGTR